MRMFRSRQGFSWFIWLALALALLLLLLLVNKPFFEALLDRSSWGFFR